jgi:type IV pilus assembly protein PilA
MFADSGTGGIDAYADVVAADQANLKTASINAVSIDKSTEAFPGTITIDMTLIPALSAAGDLTFRPTIGGSALANNNAAGTIVWNCKKAGSDTTIDPKYLPATCK